MTGRAWCVPIRSKVPPQSRDDPHRGDVGLLALAATFSDFFVEWSELAQLLRIALLDYLIRPPQERRRDRQAEGFGGLEVDRQLELARALVTLATLGYGDIVPRSDLARGLAVVEGIGGQLFLAVLVARLVSSYVRDKDGTG
jgi:ion channel